jgi:hypothetical protein
VFLRYASGPTTNEHVLERFGLAWALKRITDDCFDQIEHSHCGIPVSPDPKKQVITELGMKNCDALTFLVH